MRTVISFVGSSDSGKTTVIERLIPVLRGRGYEVATVKHASHGFEMDRDGSDTSRHREAGSGRVAIVGGGRLSVDVPDAPLGTIAERHLADADIVIAEGFSTERGPKVLVHRSGLELKELNDPSEVIAAVTDEPLGYACEVSPEQLEELADIIERHVFRAETELTLIVDGHSIPITEFVQDIISTSVLGMVSTLKRVPTKPRSVELYIRRG